MSATSLQAAPTASNLTTADMLTAGLATFTLAGNGRRYTFQVERAESTSPGSSPLYFVRAVNGSAGLIYIGVYQPDYGWLKLTSASKLPADDETVRAFRWFVGCVWNLREHEIDVNGFAVTWEVDLF